MQVIKAKADELKDVFSELSLKDNTEFDEELAWCLLDQLFDMFRKYSERSSDYVSKLLELLFPQLANDLMKEELPDSAKSI